MKTIIALPKKQQKSKIWQNAIANNNEHMKIIKETYQQ